MLIVADRGCFQQFAGRQAIEHQVAARVAPGSRATTSYVYFGVFRSGPELGIHH